KGTATRGVAAASGRKQGVQVQTSPTIWLAVSTLYYPGGGGHAWVCLNWALSLKRLGYDVVWLEGVGNDIPPDRLDARLAHLRHTLRPYGIDSTVTLFAYSEDSPCVFDEHVLDHDDVLLSFSYSVPEHVVSRFQRAALID